MICTGIILLAGFGVANMSVAQYTQMSVNNLVLFTGDEGRRQMRSLAAVSPDFARIYINDVYGDILNRSVLNSRDRRIVAICALVATNASSQQLRPHLAAALQDDLSASELEDLMLQTAAYTGFSKPINAMLILGNIPAYQQQRQVTVNNKQRTLAERYQIGATRFSKLDGTALDNLRKNFDRMSPDLVDSTFRLFGDLYARDALDLRTRQLAVVSTLAAMGTAPRQLKFHIKAALNVGVKREEIMEIMILLQPHAGMPAAYNGMFAAKEAFQQRDTQTQTLMSSPTASRLGDEPIN